jgi:hypothetical protein
VDVSIKVIDENVNLTRINKYFSKEAWNHPYYIAYSHRKKNK